MFKNLYKTNRMLALLHKGVLYSEGMFYIQ